MPHPCATFLDPLSSQEQGRVMALAQPWAADADEVLFRQGDPAMGLWLLDAGLVRYEFATANERQMVMSFSGAGACIGELEILEQRPYFSTAIASSRCQGWTLSPASSLEAIETVPGFAKLLLMKLARNLRLSLMAYQLALTLAPHQRLAMALLDLARAQAGPDGQTAWIAAVTQDMLCQVTGTSRQFVSKHLSQWAEAGWIAPRYRSLEVLDRVGLRSVLPAAMDPDAFNMLTRVKRGDEG